MTSPYKLQSCRIELQSIEPDNRTAPSENSSNQSIKRVSTEPAYPQDPLIASTAIAIESKCPKLDNVIYFKIYWAKLSYLLGVKGYTQTFEYLHDRIELPLYDETEEILMQHIIWYTIRDDIYLEAAKRDTGCSSKSVNILVALDNECREARIHKATQLRIQLENLRIKYFRKRVFFKKVKEIEKEVSTLCLTDIISKDEILRITYNDIRKSGSHYLRWAQNYETENCLDNNSTYLTFDSIDDLYDKLHTKRSMRERIMNMSFSWRFGIILIIFLALGVLVLFFVFLTCLTDSKCRHIGHHEN